MPSLSKIEVYNRFRNRNLGLLSEYKKSCESVKIKCYCGNSFYAKPRDVFRDNTRSCGCYSKIKTAERFRKDATNKKFGKLTAIRSIRSDKNQHMIWLFRCDCGVEKEIPLAYVSTKKGIRSCGCSKNKPSVRWSGHGDISGTYWSYIKRNSKKNTSKRNRDIDFKISIEDVWNLFLQQKRKCALTGVDLKFVRQYAHKKDGEEQTASLDRIDSSKGYTLDNVQWVHKVVNKMKMNLDEKDFYTWCKLVYEKMETV